MKTVNIKGTEVPEARVVYALQFLNDMEERFGTDFIQNTSIQGVSENV